VYPDDLVVTVPHKGLYIKETSKLRALD
jgi:hypothetical protein